MSGNIARKFRSIESRFPTHLDEVLLTRLGSRVKMGAMQTLLLTVATVSIYIVGFDQGQILETFFGLDAVGMNRFHEFFHDMRHIAGFMCH